MTNQTLTAKELFSKLPTLSLKTGLILLVLAIIFFGFASFLKPSQHYAKIESDFKTTIPTAFGDWHEVEQNTPQVNLVSDERSLVNQLYDDVLMRTYVNSKGQAVMLALAYAKQQRQDVKIHQPDVCYPAQGYQMLFSKNVVFNGLSSQTPILGKQQLYSGQGHLEAVSYWIRVGDETLRSGLQMRLKIIKDGLLYRRLDDGILVRVSSTVTDESQLKEAYETQNDFLASMVEFVKKTKPALLLP